MTLESFKILRQHKVAFIYIFGGKKSGYTHQLLMEKTFLFFIFSALQVKSSGQHSAQTSISLPFRRNMFEETCLPGVWIICLNFTSIVIKLWSTLLHENYAVRENNNIYSTLLQSLLKKEPILKEENKEKTWNWLTILLNLCACMYISISIHMHVLTCATCIHSACGYTLVWSLWNSVACF